MLALALGLRSAGHEAILAARPLYASDAAAFQVPFVPMGQDVEEFLRGRAGGAPGYLPPGTIEAFLDQECRAQLECLPALAEGVDLVLGAGMAMAVRSAAAAVGAPYLAVVYAPGLFMPRGRTSIFVPPVLLQTVRDFHARRGLPPVEDLLAYAFPAERVLLAADEELLGSLGGVRVWAPPTGALLLEDPRPLEDELEAFLAAGEPPIYIGFGSLAGSEPALNEQFLREVVEAVGCRAVFHAGRNAPARPQVEGPLLRIGHAAHRPLFARVAAVVHHGGAGTFAAAARAGVPQVLVPHAYDQPFWAERAYRLGIAPAPFFARGVKAPQLIASIQQALTDERLRHQARALAAVLTHRDGVGTAVACLTGAQRGAPEEKPG